MDAKSSHLLTAAEVAAVLGVNLRTLTRWRARGIGPRWVRVGDRLVRYDADALQRYLEASAA